MCCAEELGEGGDACHIVIPLCISDDDALQ